MSFVSVTIRGGGSKMADYQYLPALTRTDAAPGPQNTSAWSRESGGTSALAKYATALVLPTDKLAAERLKSVPTPLARPLLFEQALFNPGHPAHSQILAEWRGLLGAVALANYFGIEAKVKLVRLPSDDDGIMASIRSFAPRGEETHWSIIGLLSLGGDILGGSSPRTLVFSGIRPLPAGSPVPFQRNRRLVDPTRHYAQSNESEPLALLAKWIDETRRSLTQHGGALRSFVGVQPSEVGGSGVSRGEEILRLLNDWSIETHEALRQAGIPDADPFRGFLQSPFAVAGFPDTHPASRVLPLLRPIEAEAADTGSDLRMRDGDLIVDPGATGILVRNDQLFTGHVNLPRGFAQQAVEGRFDVALTPAQIGDDSAPDLGKFFQSKLVEVKNLAEGGRGLKVGGATYLLPFKEEILNHLDPNRLIQFVSARGDRAAGIVVRLEIPLRHDLSMRYEHRYHTHDVVVDYITPNVSVWPDFRSTGWDHYFYFERAAGGANVNNLMMRPVGTIEEVFSTETGADMSWGRMGESPSAWVGTAQDAKGLLLSTPLPQVDHTDEEWEISIDFGSTHTRVFRAARGMADDVRTETVSLIPRAVVITGDAGFGFFPDVDSAVPNPEEPRTLLQLPLIDTPDREQRSWLPADGTIVWESLLHSSGLPGLRSDLKWQAEGQSGHALAYVSQIYLAAGAEAAARGARITALKSAYPSVFPEYLRFQHEHQWKQLESRYGVTVHPPQKESTALAAFLDRVVGAPVNANVIAVDIGGSTADLALWREGAQSHGDSVRLAGDIVSRLVRHDEAARRAIAEAAAMPPISENITWTNDPDANSLLFNALLRQVSQEHATHPDYPGSSILAKAMFRPDGPGSYVIAHVGYLAAAISYLLGMLARHQSEEVDRYQIHFAGRGSQFLYWLLALGSDVPEEVPTVFFRAGLRSHEVAVKVVLPEEYAKQEVGRGLLVRSPQTERADVQRQTFVGENGFRSHGRDLSWDDTLDMDVLKNLKYRESAPLSEREELGGFLRAFETSEATRTIAAVLGISPDVLNSDALRDDLEHSFVGLRERAVQNADHVLLEPLFIQEVKVLLQHTTGNKHLFR